MPFLPHFVRRSTVLVLLTVVSFTTTGFLFMNLDFVEENLLFNEMGDKRSILQLIVFV